MSDLRTSLSSKINLDNSRVKPYEGFIFLCGGPANIREPLPTSLRDAVYRELAKNVSEERRIRMAEHYKDWAHDSIYSDLVLFETHIAELSSVIVLVLESAGAIAELGLFSAMAAVRDKLLVFIDSNYYKSQSFIKLGPIDFLEKTHNNNSEVHRWYRDEGKIQVFDGGLAQEIQQEVAEAVRARLKKTISEHQFSRHQWLHVALLICDLLDLFSALTLREIRDIINELGLERTELDVKQTLYLLERLELIAMEPKGEQRFYVSTAGHQYIKLHIADAHFDRDRFRGDVLADYQAKDKKRFRAIQEVRGPSMIRQPDILKRMAQDFGLLPSHLETIIKTAPLRYKQYYIPKRDGKSRLVAQPAREVKAIQRWLINELRLSLPMHQSVMAYEPGTSIRKNAYAHVRSQYLLKMDFANFFPSIYVKDIEKHLEKYCESLYTEMERKLVARSCTWLPERSATLQLCIGAPSSPMLSNSILYEFDCLIAAQAEQDSVTYTRYADDLAFSCNRRDVLSNYVQLVFDTLSQIAYPNIAVNIKKTIHASRSGNRTVTGIVITPDESLSVGRERKRLVRAMYHRATLGKLSADELDKLHGLLNFIDSIEPGFSVRLKKLIP